MNSKLPRKQCGFDDIRLLISESFVQVLDLVYVDHSGEPIGVKNLLWKGPRSQEA